MFPIRDRDGSLRGFAGRLIYPDNKLPKVRDYHYQKVKALLGFERFKRGKPIFLVEGLFGYAHCIEQGIEEFCNVLCCLGVPLTDPKIDILSSLF